jgi:hypothetical protein
MQWNKKGRILIPEKHLKWSVSHAQLPIVDPSIVNGRLRIYFSTRDERNRSLPSWVDVDASNPSKIIGISAGPMLPLGEPGTFDDCGVMPSCIINYQNLKYMYYIGWNVRSTIPFHNSVGLAVSEDGGKNWRRYADGPLWDRSIIEPFFSGTSCVLVDEGGGWHNWYLSCTEWREVSHKMEPRYNIKYATSLDGVLWKRSGHVAIDYKSEEEAGLVSATVIKSSGRFHMWFAYRNIDGYRTDTAQSYRIGYASSNDGKVWQRRDNASGISVSETGWDSDMICYPHVVKLGAEYLMLYNGNGFGSSGFGFATSNRID